MAVPLEYLEALAATPGCTIDHLMAVLRADQARRDRLRAERLARKAALLGLPVAPSPLKMNIADSVATSESASAPVEVPIGGYHKTVARMAALGSTELRPGAKLVVAVLVEHHNLRTGRCDPSTARIAEKTGLSARSVRRAVGELEAAGLLRRRVHGGRYHANAYVLDWARLEALAGRAAAFNRSGPDQPQMNKADSDVATRTLVAAEPDARVHQNDSLKQNPSVDVERSRARPAHRFNPLQRELPLLRRMPDTADKGDVAHGKAEARIWDDIRQRFTGEELAQLLAHPALDAAHENAVRSEMSRTGTGLVRLLRELGRETGPPSAASGG